MHKMMQIRESLVDELEKFADKPINEQNLEYIDKLSHAIKCIDTVRAMERSEQESRDDYSGRMYRDGASGRHYRDDYSEDGASGRRYYYTQRDSGVSGRRRRDSMGRYASEYRGGSYDGRGSYENRGSYNGGESYDDGMNSSYRGR